MLTEGFLFDPRSEFLERDVNKRRYLGGEWVWPDYLSKVENQGQVWVISNSDQCSHDGIVGVALWEPPRSALSSSSRVMLSFTSLALSPLVAGISATVRLSQVRKMIEETHERLMGAKRLGTYKPHWYLIAQGTHLQRQKAKTDSIVDLPEDEPEDDVSRTVRDALDRDMLQELCRRADSDHFPCYCETFDQNRMLPLLKEFGFIVREEISSPIPMWALVREPGSS